MASNQLSRDAYDRLAKELDELTGVGRVEIANAIEAARALGDLSENGDYHAAKDAQGHMEARIRKIQGLLEDVEIVDAGASDTVVVGSVVGIKYDGDDDVEQYLVGSIEERREGIEVASPESPLGSALLGHKAGDVVEYETPTGAKLKVEIATIGD
ncbi:MAG: transcription elongation factor GreA [Acidimicrobiales bacterium]|nr:transcription elongation factor GreA [Acidimicrobiales bacterium]